MKHKKHVLTKMAQRVITLHIEQEKHLLSQRSSDYKRYNLMYIIGKSTLLGPAEIHRSMLDSSKIVGKKYIDGQQNYRDTTASGMGCVEGN